LLLDESSEVRPIEVQPYLADHLKRVIAGSKTISVKVAAIEHRSRIGVRLEDRSVLGFEEEADMFPVKMLDETPDAASGRASRSA
jgi:hypothetical protein